MPKNTLWRQSIPTIWIVLILAVPHAAMAAGADAGVYVTRGEASLLILRTLGTSMPDPWSIDGRYPDVLAEEWYAPALAAAIEKNMLSVDPVTNRARPHGLIGRADFLRMLTESMGLTKNQPHAYTDVTPTQWYAPYAGVAARYKLFLDRRDARRLRADLPLTHREAAQMFYQVLQEQPTWRTVLFSPRPSFIAQKPMTPAPLPPTTPPSTPPPSSPTTPSIPQTLRQIVTKFFPQEDPSVLQRELLIAINAERVKKGIPALTLHPLLSAAALGHARDMEKRGYFSHFSPEGKTYIDRIRASGYTDVDPVACGCLDPVTMDPSVPSPQMIGPHMVTYSADICECRPRVALGENLARGQRSVQEVVKDWMASESHRRTILESAFRETGFAKVGAYWAQTFATFETN